MFPTTIPISFFNLSLSRWGERVAFIEVVRRDRAAVLKLSRGVTNSLNLQLVNQLREYLKELREGSDRQSLVLSSHNDKFFSIGFDIPGLSKLGKEDFKIFYQAFNRLCMDLYTLPAPTIAAITGHAIAGGCILALCCDYRFIAEGRRLMGLNEIKLGVPVPYPGDCILRQIIGARHAREMMSTGEFYRPRELLEMGVVDHVLPLDQVIQQSIEKAEMLIALPCEPFKAIKRNRVESVEAEVQEHLAERENFFLDCWYSKETRKRLREAIKKF
jgi:enoyl-CoA hydratase/carnithine racemase